MAIYEKPVKLLFHDMVKELTVQKGDILERDKIISWFRQYSYDKYNYPFFQVHIMQIS